MVGRGVFAGLREWRSERCGLRLQWARLCSGRGRRLGVHCLTWRMKASGCCCSRHRVRVVVKARVASSEGCWR